MRAPIHIGCSGWQYAAWKGTFYPASLPTSQWLEYYCGHFDTVEVNNSFYRLPERSTFERWAAQLPAGFVMAVKGSGYLTHRKRLRDPEEPLVRLFDSAAGLGDHLGPVLYQLPSTLRCDRDRLASFLGLLPDVIGGVPVRHVIEFRHPSWYEDAVFALLEEHGVALCLHDKKDSEWTDRAVGPFVYIRFHGTSGHYKGSYSRRALHTWADRIGTWAADGRAVFAYFNNDPGATAVRNAASLVALVNVARMNTQASGSRSTC